MCAKTGQDTTKQDTYARSQELEINIFLSERIVLDGKKDMENEHEFPFFVFVLHSHAKQYQMPKWL